MQYRVRDFDLHEFVGRARAVPCANQSLPQSLMCRRRNYRMALPALLQRSDHWRAWSSRIS